MILWEHSHHCAEIGTSIAAHPYVYLFPAFAVSVDTGIKTGSQHFWTFGHLFMWLMDRTKTRPGVGKHNRAKHQSAVRGYYIDLKIDKENFSAAVHRHLPRNNSVEASPRPLLEHYAFVKGARVTLFVNRTQVRCSQRHE